MRSAWLFLGIFVVCAGCGSGGGSSGVPTGGAGGTAGSGGAAGLGGSSGAAGESPFAAELCNEGFCWEEPKPFAGSVNALAVAGSTVWLAGEGMIARRAGGGWTAAAAPDAAALNGIFAFADDDVWAVGSEGTIVHFDGVALGKVESPTSATLYGIWGAAPDDIWAVGDYGTIVHYDGSAWSSVSGGADELHAVWGSGPNDVYAVGGTLNVGTVAHFNGSGWTSSMSSLSGAGFYAVSGTGPDNVFAAGEYGHMYRLGPDGSQQYLGGDAGRISALVAKSPTEAWALSDGNLLYWNGVGFVDVAPLGGNALVRDPHSEQLLIGGRGVAGYAPGLITTEIAAPSFSQLWIGPDRAIAVDEGGKILHREAGGWSEVAGIAGNSYWLAVGGLGDGTRVIVDRENDPAEIFFFNGASLQKQASLSQERLYDAVIAGLGGWDFWIFNASGPSHFDGSSWQLGSWPPLPGFEVSFSPAAALVIASNDVWVVGGSESSSGQAGAGVAHFDGTGWTRALAGEAGTSFTSIARFNGKLYAAGGRTDYTLPKEMGWVYYPEEPVLYENQGGAWIKVAIPGVVPEYQGTSGALVAASDSELFFVLEDPHPGLANLLVYDGSTFSERPYPATECSAVFTSPDGTLRLLAGNHPFGILRSR